MKMHNKTPKNETIIKLRGGRVSKMHESKMTYNRKKLKSEFNAYIKNTKG